MLLNGIKPHRICYADFCNLGQGKSVVVGYDNRIKSDMPGRQQKLYFVLMGEHGCRGVALSVPSVVGPAGVQLRIREKWAPEEYRGFFDAVESVRRAIGEIKI